MSTEEKLYDLLKTEHILAFVEGGKTYLVSLTEDGLLLKKAEGQDLYVVNPKDLCDVFCPQIEDIYNEKYERMNSGLAKAA